jgi:hypothetical protein
VDEEIYIYNFLTDDDEKTLAYFQSLQANCKLEYGHVNLDMTRAEIPSLIQSLVGQGIGIYAVNQKQRTLEQDFINLTTGSKTQIQ